MAMHNAAADVFPEVKIHGCLFHLLKAWNDRLDDINDLQEFKTILAIINALPFLPLDEPQILADVNSLIDETVATPIVKSSKGYSKLMSFLHYLRNTYLSLTARFKPSSWATPNFESCRQNNTNWSNNCAETLNAILKRYVNQKFINTVFFISVSTNSVFDKSCF